MKRCSAVFILAVSSLQASKNDLPKEHHSHKKLYIALAATAGFVAIEVVTHQHKSPNNVYVPLKAITCGVCMEVAK